MEHRLRVLQDMRVPAMVWACVALAVALDGAAGLAGALLPERWLVRHRAPLLGFAAGALLATGLVELFPDAWRRLGVGALAWSLGAIAVLAIAERVASPRGPVSPATLMVSDGLHNIGDGMAIAAGFLVSLRLGIVTAVAVILHEVPEEIADYALLRSAGVSRGRSLLALASVQLSAALGAAGTLLASSSMDRAAGIVVAIAAGTFVHIGAVDLVPELARLRSWSGYLALAGAALLVVVA